MEYIIEDLLPTNQVHLLGGPSGAGKAQPMNAMIQGPMGEVTMDMLEVGDKIYAVDGSIQTVDGLYPQGMREVYRVTFSDGRQADCTWDHLWEVYHADWGVNKVLNLAAVWSKHKDSTTPLSITLPDPVPYQEQSLSIAPYLLGALLGDGSFANNSVGFSNIDSEILNRVRSLLPSELSMKFVDRCNYRVSGVRGRQNSLVDFLHTSGLARKHSWDKFIPSDYMRGSISQRSELLAGLLDTDGYVSDDGRLYFDSTSLQLATQVQRLVRSLGGYAKMAQKNTTHTYKGAKRAGRTSYGVNIKITNPKKYLFLSRKRDRIEEPKSLRLAIKDISYLGLAECQCIKVSSPRALYLTNDFVATHNTTLAFQMYKALLNGEDFVGRRTKKVKWAYISGDRPERSVQETQERVQCFFPIFSSVDYNLVGKDLMKDILPRITSHYSYRPDFIYIDGFTAMVPGGKLNDYGTVSEWLANLQRYCAAKNVTIMGACHTTKTKENEKFLNPRQRIAGSVAWAGFSESVIIIEPDEGLEDKNKRWVHLLPRNKASESLMMYFDEEGVLQLPDKMKHQEEVADLVVGPLLAGITGPLDYRDLLKKATVAGVSRRSFDRYLSRLVDEGSLLHGKRGEYSIPEGKKETK